MQEQSADSDDGVAESAVATDGPRRNRRRVVAIASGVAIVAALAAAWSSRQTIVGDIVNSQLEKRGIPATYKIASISARRQVLTDLVIGDPAHPDFTAKVLEVQLVPRFGLPGIGRVRLVEPRLYGTYRNGKLSFGKLDPLIFTGGTEPFSMPDMDLTVEDGRGLIEGDFGAVGISLDGAGPLRGGFAGELAATAPHAAFGGCVANGATLYGKVRANAQKPSFSGPVRIGGLNCSASGLHVDGASFHADLTGTSALDGVEGKLSARSGAIAMGSDSLAGTGGTASFTYRKAGLTARYALTGTGLVSPQAQSRSVNLTGQVRSSANFARLEVDGDASGELTEPGASMLNALGKIEKAAGGTFAGDLLAKARPALVSEARSARFSGQYVLRREHGGTSIVVPQFSLKGRSGATLLSASRIQVALAGSGPPIVSGNFATGGRGLPQINGRMEQSGGQSTMRLRVARYEAGTASIEVPQIYVVQRPGGEIGFSGLVMASGALPGGSARNLRVPVSGHWSGRGGLALWPRCTAIDFDQLTLAAFTFDRHSALICPSSAGAIVRSGPKGLTIAGGVPALDLAGHVGATPARISSGPVGFAWPGNLDARKIEVALGPDTAKSDFTISHLAASLSGTVAGTFDDAGVKLAAVPLDMSAMKGNWSYANGVLSLDEGHFILTDRQQVARFEPLVADGASLSMKDNVILAQATLRDPKSGHEIVDTHIRHDLESGSGHADLDVPGIVFDKDLQPDTLSYLALGVIANAQGTVRGKGRIDWTADRVTSSGDFRTDAFDFAAAFGPVKGVSGSVRFTDLLGLVTAPDQTLHVASINPGIEVNDGTVTFALKPGYLLDVQGAQWPFQGGTLRLEPVRMTLGSKDPSRYVLDIDGLDAALFVQHLDMANLAATGVFDGKLPLVFDKDGGRIDDGYLVSRPPGGNVAYVGALTYKDLSAMANFAFQALRSLNYRKMQIGLGGSLEGDIVTSVTFDGISQGKGASSNFLTRRIASLPIRFKVNIRAPFMQLMTSARGLYDPAYVRDPRTLGLVDVKGHPMASARPAAPANPAPATSDARTPALAPRQQPVQHLESETVP